MNAHSRTLSLPGAALPMRERGASVLDRAVVWWPAPDPGSRVLGTWDAPSGHAVVRAGLAPWAAPDPVMRFDLPGPQSLHLPASIDRLIRRGVSVEPQHRVPLPDLAPASASLAAIAVPMVDVRPAQPWPAPTLATSASVEVGVLAPTKGAPGRSGITPRLIIGLAAAAGALAAGAAALISLL